MRFKEPEKLREFMRRISNHSYKFDYEELKMVCNKHFTSLPVRVIEFNNSPGFFGQNQMSGINYVYRARLNEQKDGLNVNWNNVSNISYISNFEDLRKVKFGRANKAGESMFYGAFDFATACAEATKANVLESSNSAMLTVGRWQFISPLNLAQLSYSEKSFIDLYNTVSFKPKRLTLEDIRLNGKVEREQFEFEIDYEVMRFFTDEFGSQNTNYFLSNYYTDRVFNRIPQHEMEVDIDGIIYPSTVFSYERNNIVLRPEIFKQGKMRFMDAMQVWLVSFHKSGGGAQFIPIKQGIEADQNGKLLWGI